MIRTATGGDCWSVAIDTKSASTMIGDSLTLSLSELFSILLADLCVFLQTRRAMERFDAVQRSSAADAEIPGHTLIVETFVSFLAFRETLNRALSGNLTFIKGQIIPLPSCIRIES